jgi:hypothetical protein
MFVKEFFPSRLTGVKIFLKPDLIFFLQEMQSPMEAGDVTDKISQQITNKSSGFVEDFDPQKLLTDDHCEQMANISSGFGDDFDPQKLLTDDRCEQMAKILSGVVDDFDPQKLLTDDRCEQMAKISSGFVEDFEPEKFLGRGGFGNVFLCLYRLNWREFAVKRVLLPAQLFKR